MHCKIRTAASVQSFSAKAAVKQLDQRSEIRQELHRQINVSRIVSIISELLFKAHACNISIQFNLVGPKCARVSLPLVIYKMPHGFV